MEAEILVGTHYFAAGFNVLYRDFFQLVVDNEVLDEIENCEGLPVGYTTSDEKLNEIMNNFAKLMFDRGLKDKEYTIINGQRKIGSHGRIKPIPNNIAKSLEGKISAGFYNAKNQ